jgi:hypothetical protein
MNTYKDHQIDFFKKVQEKYGRNVISKTEALELSKEMGRKTATWPAFGSSCSNNP